LIHLPQIDDRDAIERKVSSFGHAPVPVLDWREYSAATAFGAPRYCIEQALARRLRYRATMKERLAKIQSHHGDEMHLHIREKCEFAQSTAPAAHARRIDVVRDNDKQQQRPPG
jgi:hypothetical protein